MLEGVTLSSRYRLDEKLGAGGMGEVWKGFDLRLGRVVAVKVFPNHPDPQPRRVERFRTEARLCGQLQHPGIVVIHDADEDNGQLFFVMELLEGKDLAKIMSDARNGLPIDRVITIGARLADALTAAHSRRIIHRDIKPANIMLLPADRPKLCDFGIARVLDSGHAKATVQVGTAAYMSPEQCNGEPDERSDLYSLGCVLYEMLTGDTPFLGNFIQLVYQHGMVAPKRPSATRSGIPSQLEDLVLHLLAKKPEDRPQTAAEVASQLQALHDRMNRASRQPVPSALEPVTQLPPDELLKSGTSERKYTDADDAAAKAIDEVLRRAQVDARVAGYVRGPSMSRFEVRLGPKTPKAAVFALLSAFAAALGNARVRLAPMERSTSPLPRVTAVGVEVPHRSPDLVSLGDVLRDIPNNGELLAGLGRTQDGSAIFLNVKDSRHLLIFGSSEKIDPLRSIIASVAMRQKPSQLRLVLIDSSQQRLAAFLGLPHTVNEAAEGPLDWLLAEMERRYADLAKTHCRTIEQFNREVRAGRQPTPIALGDRNLAHPDLLVIVDELAEAIREAPKEAIRELTREGRAVGIHVVARTASPTDDVITSQVTSYIPARLALPVSSVEESLRVLDRSGAESLLPGDGLFVSNSHQIPKRLRLAVISDEEISAIVTHWRG